MKGAGHETRFYPGGGDTLLGYSLWGENLYLGYSLPRRKFSGEVLPCDTENELTILTKTHRNVTSVTISHIFLCSEDKYV